MISRFQFVFNKSASKSISMSGRSKKQHLVLSTMLGVVRTSRWASRCSHRRHHLGTSPADHHTSLPACQQQRTSRPSAASHRPAQNSPFFSAFHVCPEPVLVKCSFLVYNGAKKDFPRTGCRLWRGIRAKVNIAPAGVRQAGPLSQEVQG